MDKLPKQIGVKKLKNMYDEHVLHVLGLIAVNNKCEVAKNLPTKEEYEKLKIEAYTTTVFTLVQCVFNDLHDLDSELFDSYGSLPENLQKSKKARDTKRLIDSLRDIYEERLELSKYVSSLMLVHIPGTGKTRQDRLLECTSMLQSVHNRLVVELCGLENKQKENTENWTDSDERAACEISDLIANIERMIEDIEELNFAKSGV